MEIDYTKMLEMISDGYWLVSNKLEILDVNQNLCQMLGYEKQEIIGKKVFDFSGDDDRPILEDMLLLQSSATIESHEMTLRKKTGEAIACLCKTAAVRDRSENLQGYFSLVIKSQQVENGVK